ncbi:MAG TPA: sirohydrochlorin chelatase [Sporichthyaceae bacterium]|jgi:sirohydrochlorin ferrochelatase
MASDPVLVAVAHGSRRPAAQDDVRTLLAAVRAARPGLAVREAYIELAEPSLPEVLRSEPGAAVVVPLLLGSGYHIAHDVAGVAAAYRDVPCAAALGPDPLLAEALADRLSTAEAGEPSDGPIVLAAAGSSDPRSHADTETMAGMLAMRLGRPVVPAYNCSARPGVRDTVAALRGRRYRRISVVGYLLWPGRFAAEVAACGADVVSGPIGLHPALVRLVLSRYDLARVAAVQSRVA